MLTKMISLRPRSALLHGQSSHTSQSSLVPLPRPGSSQTLRRNRTSRSKLGRRQNPGKKNFRFQQSNSNKHNNNNNNKPARSLEANLSNAFKSSSNTNTNHPLIQARNTCTKPTASSTTLKQSLLSSTTNNEPPSKYNGNGTISTTNFPQMSQPFDTVPTTDSGNTTERSSDSEEDRNAASSSEDTDINNINNTAVVLISSSASAPALSVMNDHTALMLPATAALLSNNNTFTASTTTATPVVASSTLGASTIMTTATSQVGTTAIIPNNNNNNNNGPQSIRSTSRNLSRPMTTQSNSNRRQRKRVPLSNTNQFQFNSGINPQHFAISNLQANNRRPGTAPERNPVGITIGNGNQNMSEEDTRRENARLRQQLERMRLESFNKIRGGKRFVSGGGFRAARNNDEPDNRKNNRNASEIQHLKHTIRQLQTEKQNFVSELADGNMRLNRCISNQKTLFNQVKTVEMERDRMQETISVRERLISDQSHRLDEQEKSIELSLGKQRAQMEEILRLQAQLRRVTEENAHGSPQRSRSSDVNEIDRLKKEIEKMKIQLTTTINEIKIAAEKLLQTTELLNTRTEELSKCNTKLVETRQEKKDAEFERDKCKKLMEKSKNELSKSQDVVRTLQKENNSLIKSNKEKDIEIARLKTSNGDTSALDKLQKQLDHMEIKNKSMELKYRNEMEKLRAQLALLETETGSLQMRLSTSELCQKAAEERGNQAEARCSTYQDELMKLRQRIEELEALLASKDKELSRLRSNQKDGKGKNGELQKEMDALKRQLNAAKAEAKAIRNQFDEQIQRARDAEMVTRTTQKALKMTETELKRTEKDFAVEQEISEKLREQLAEMAKKMSNTKQLIMDAANKARREALESSLQSMVRLCVVAPTVNVHFNSQQQQCKAPMPAQRIKNIIENQVLPNFSELFIQLEEGTAQNGDRLDTWLEGMLGEMQKSIQSHLADVFTEQNGNSKNESIGNTNNNVASKRPQSQSASRRPSIGGRGKTRPNTRGGY